MRRIAPAFTFLLLALLALAPRPLAQDKPEAKAAAKREYFIYFNGGCIGWAKSARHTVEQDGKRLVQDKDSAFVSIVREGEPQAFNITSESEVLMTEAGMPLKQTETSTDAAQKRRSEAVYAEGKITITDAINGAESKSTEIDCTGKTLGSTLWAWTAIMAKDGAQKGETAEFYELSLEKQVLEKETWTVSGSVKRKTLKGKEVEGTEVVIVKGGNILRFVIDEQGLPCFATLPAGMTMEVTDTIPADFKADVVRVSAMMLSKVAIEDWRSLKQMDVVIEYKHDDGEGIDPLFDENEYHSVEKYQDDKGSGYGLRLKARKLAKDFKAPALPMAELPEDVSRFLKATAACESEDADLAKEAKRLAGKETDSRVVANKVMRWVYSYLEKESGATGAASAKTAYKEKKGDCTEHAALFVAVARAAGLPARCVGGIVYLTSEGVGIFGYHAWAEVWLGQWVPVDATVNELGTSARYLMMEIDEPGETRGGGRIARCLGQSIKPQITAYELEDGTSWKQKGAREFKFGAKPEGESK